MVTGVEEEQNLAVLVRPVADEGASGRIFALVVVVPKRFVFSTFSSNFFQGFLNIQQRYLGYFSLQT